MSDQELSHLSLGNISPFDGREILFTKGLREILSEGALHRYRAIVEIEKLRELVSPEKFDATAVNDYDHFGRNGIGPTEHDAKSVELYLREALAKAGLGRFSEFVHFPATSHDINNIAYNLMLRDAVNNVWLPKVLEVTDKLAISAEMHADVPILGITHGMNASPTTVGKRFGYTFDK